MSTLTQKQTVNDFHWPNVGESGRVPIESVIENPRNPRTYFDQDETGAMANSIKKGKQREIATVRLIQPSDNAPEGVRFMLTSGARRYRGARKAGETHFDIRVKAYESLGEEMLDALMLNEDRKPVSDLELGRYYRDLMAEKNWTQAELADAISRSAFWVSDRLMILKCTDKVQARMHPEQKSRMLNLQVGIAFSKMQPELQDELIDAMPAALETAASQLHWLETQINIRGVEVPRRKRQPRTYRVMFAAFATTMRQKADFVLSPDFSRLFENTTDSEANQLARDMRAALGDFEKLVRKVEELAASEKKQTMLVPRERMGWGQRNPAPQVVQVTKPRTAPTAVAALRSNVDIDAVQRSQVERYSTQQSSVTQKPVEDAKVSTNTMVTVEYLHDNGRFVLDKVDLGRFCELWDNGKLKFQVIKTPRPSSYPDRNDIYG